MKMNSYNQRRLTHQLKGSTEGMQLEVLDSSVFSKTSPPLFTLKRKKWINRYFFCSKTFKDLKVLVGIRIWNEISYMGNRSQEKSALIDKHAFYIF